MKNIVIIGASSGIGSAIAEICLNSGDRVVLCGRRIEMMQNIAAKFPETAIVEQLDIRLTKAAEQTLVAIFHHLHSVDIFVLSSGIGEMNESFSFEKEADTIATNVTGFTAVADFALNQFLSQGFGHFVAITSVAGLRGNPGAPAYNASKAYQINYLEAMRLKAAKSGLPVFITDIRPGFVDTAMAQGEGLFFVAPVMKAAVQICQAIRKRKKVVYVSRRWRWVAFLYARLPFALLSKM